MSSNVERLEAWWSKVVDRHEEAHDLYRALLAAWRYIEADNEHKRLMAGDMGGDTVMLCKVACVSDDRFHDAVVALNELIGEPGGAAIREDAGSATGEGPSRPVGGLNSPPGEPSLADLIYRELWRRKDHDFGVIANDIWAYIADTEATNPEAAARLREALR